MKIFLVPIVLASSLISTAAIASEIQVVHSDNKPRRCEMLSKGKVVATCSSFKLQKKGKLYAFTYYFKESPIMFLSAPMTENKSTTTYGSTKIYYNGKFNDIKEIAICVTSKRYEMIQCSNNGVNLEYSRW
jgi:hypothetical protein